ncbi:hypothetical protein ACFX2C_009096 [Malus domestica]
MEVQAAQLKNSRSLFPLSLCHRIAEAERNPKNQVSHPFLPPPQALSHGLSPVTAHQVANHHRFPLPVDQTPIRVVLHRFSFSYHRPPPLAAKCSLRRSNLKCARLLIMSFSLSLAYLNLRKDMFWPTGFRCMDFCKTKASLANTSFICLAGGYFGNMLVSCISASVQATNTLLSRFWMYFVRDVDLDEGVAQFVSKFAEPGDPEYNMPVQKGETPTQSRAQIHQLRLCRN